MAKTKRPQFLTPKCEAHYPWLVKPDMQFAKNGVGVLSVQLTMDEADYAAIVDHATPIMSEYITGDIAAATKEYEEAKGPNKPKAKKALEERQKAQANGFNLSVKDEYDESGESPTGRKTVIFKQKSVISWTKNGEKFTEKVVIPIFDAKGQPIQTHDKFKNVLSTAPAIYGGSILKVRYEVVPAFIPLSGTYHATLRPVAVQVIELSTGGARSASSYGFEEEEGYTYDNSNNGGFTDESDTSPPQNEEGDGVPSSDSGDY